MIECNVVVLNPHRHRAIDSFGTVSTIHHSLTSQNFGALIFGFNIHGGQLQPRHLSCQLHFVHTSLDGYFGGIFHIDNMVYGARFELAMLKMVGREGFEPPR